jgi:hypothetical protein
MAKFAFTREQALEALFADREETRVYVNRSTGALLFVSRDEYLAAGDPASGANALDNDRNLLLVPEYDDETDEYPYALEPFIMRLPSANDRAALLTMLHDATDRTGEIEAYLRADPDLATAYEAYNRGDSTPYRFIAWLRQHGIEAELVG